MAFSYLICSLALLVSALALLASLVFLSRLGLPKVQRSGRVSLILPLTGSSPGLENLLQALAAQSLMPRRMILCVESEDDPAYARATSLGAFCPFLVEVVVAGHASRCAQKCANQMAALQRVDTQDEAVVLLDADILPPVWWLSALVSPLLDGSADVVSGYRWQRLSPPAQAFKPGAHLLASIDRGIALLPRLDLFNVVWGGSLALSPRALAGLQAERILGTTLSDDCALGEQAGAIGLKVLTRRALLVPTPASAGLVSVWRFGRRQYQIIRIHRPLLWWLAFGVLSTRIAAWGVLLARLDQRWAQLVLAALIGLSLAGFVAQSMVAQRLGFPDTAGARFGQALLAVLKPLVDLFHWTVVMAAIAAGTVRWGHVVYRVRGPGEVTVVSRNPWT